MRDLDFKLNSEIWSVMLCNCNNNYEPLRTNFKRAKLQMLKDKTMKGTCKEDWLTKSKRENVFNCNYTNLKNRCEFIHSLFHISDKRPKCLSLSQVVDMDNSLEVTRQELGRMRSRGDEEDERWRAREQELLVRLEDSRCRERKLEDQKHNLEVCLADASQQLQELKVRGVG